MKKFILALVAALAVMATSSCDGGTPWGIEYSLKSNGKADAAFAFTFVNGSCELNGNASYNFVWENVHTLSATKGAIPLDKGLLSGDKETLRAAQEVNDWLDQWFKITSFEGYYDVRIKGYVKETKTQITFEIDRRFTNLPENLQISN